MTRPKPTQRKLIEILGSDNQNLATKQHSPIERDPLGIKGTVYLPLLILEVPPLVVPLANLHPRWLNLCKSHNTLRSREKLQKKNRIKHDLANA
jgi:hypothetical protein